MGENAFYIEQILVKNAQCIEQNYHKIAFCIEQMMDWIMGQNIKWGPLVGLPFFDYRGFVYFALWKWGLATAWTTVVASHQTS